jgi:hypothetical protein
MKFSQLGQGKAAERPTEFPLIDAEGNAVVAQCLLRPIDGSEETAAIVFAAEYAKTHGADDAREGHPLWDLGYMVKAIAIACVDQESPERKREPFFDGGTDQVLKLPRETIAFIFEAQQTWQDLTSPTQKKMAGHELLDKVREIAEAESDLPFLRLSPALRWICMRSMACLLMRSQEDSSRDSSFFVSTGASLSTSGSSATAASERTTDASPTSPTES